MHRIQAAALDLFDERGYPAVTVEEIAEAADVSPSSVYRYFGAKERLVLWNDHDPRLIERMAEELTHVPPLEAARRVMVAVMTQVVGEDEALLRRRVRHVMADPTLEAASAALAYSTSETFGRVLAERVGRQPADLELQVFAHALVGGLLGCVHHWHGTGFAEPLRDVLAQCFDLFEAGLRVVAAPIGAGGGA